MLLLLLTAVQIDTADYTIYNHGRVAGAMRVVSGGDSAAVRYEYQDRQHHVVPNHAAIQEAGHAKPEITACELDGVADHQPHDLGERQRGEGQIRTTQAHDDASEHKADEASDDDRSRNADVGFLTLVSEIFGLFTFTSSATGFAFTS